MVGTDVHNRPLLGVRSNSNFREVLILANEVPSSEDASGHIVEPGLGNAAIFHSLSKVITPESCIGHYEIHSSICACDASVLRGPVRSYESLL